ncbi:unnamed protein product [Rodentolepis nana]|uniref:E3 ubiquitin-protein ligase n=1 Tax=Rodentolepis nana TaxID=102285 RepID=A0A0R3TTT4_RODNA|nr:unnamed protein product [Rodentolepis nana]
MDLPLSQPLLKIIVSYSEAGANLRQPDFHWLENVENRVGPSSCRRFIAHWKLSGSRHWLTGLLDEEDFLLLYPHYRSILPGLLELYRRQRTLLEDGDGLRVELLRPFIDSTSKEIFGVELDDLCIPMTVECNSHMKTTTVKLRDVYPWESGNATTTCGDDEVEYVTSDNYGVYIRRLLEFCLDKGIRAQMEAFVCGFERVFPLKWLSMFTCTEVQKLVSGQLAEKPWSLDELKANILFGDFSENSKTIEYFFKVLIGFNVEERRKFLRFATGCSTLPMNGWKDLSPKFQVHKSSEGSRKAYPCAQACFNTLYLREYATLQELRDHLIFAINQTSFLIA